MNSRIYTNDLGNALMTENSKRGIVGWVTLILFFGFNLLIFVNLIIGLNSNESMVGFGLMGLGMIWAVGFVILGLLAYFTRNY